MKKKIGLWMYTNENGDLIQDKIKAKLEKLSYEVINDFDMRECYCFNGEVYTKDNINLSKLDVLYHMNADEQNLFQNDILRVLEKSGVLVFNSFESFYNAKDKFTTNLFLRKNGITVPPSLFIGTSFSDGFISSIFKEWKSVLVKPRRHHGGVGIMKYDNYETFKDFFLATSKFMDNYYIEKFIEFGDHDYRVEVFNRKILGGYSRQKKHSFKSNVGSGGKMLSIPVGDEQKEIALKSAKVLNITTTIVDMVRSIHDNQLYVLEVNPIMGIFVEAGMKSGSRMPIHDVLPEQFCYDDVKMNAIVEHIVNLCK